MGSGDDGEGELAAWCTQAAAAAEFSGPPEELEDGTEGASLLVCRFLTHPFFFAGLTQFDVRRPPIRARPPGFETVTIPLKALNNEFRCPVCLGILRESSTTMECLHRFCNDCITKSLRLGSPSQFACPMFLIVGVTVGRKSALLVATSARRVVRFVRTTNSVRSFRRSTRTSTSSTPWRTSAS